MYALLAILFALVGGRILINAASSIVQVPSSNDDLAWW
jgi:hypothetical protein